MKSSIFFDLDGTLIDPIEGLGRSVRHSLKMLGAPPLPEEHMGRFIGPPLLWSYMNLCGFSEQQARQAIKHFQSYYRDKGVYEHRLYSGIEEMLHRLYQNGRRLFLATSKPLVFARHILEQHKLDKLFSGFSSIVAESADPSKGEIVRKAHQASGDAAENCIMVGDRSFDILGAHDNGIEAVGVLFGYGTPREFDEAGAEYTVESVPELETLLLNL